MNIMQIAILFFNDDVQVSLKVTLDYIRLLTNSRN